MARVLVTGAPGFIAGHVILQLLDAGHEVYGTARSASRAAPLNRVLSDYAGRPVEIGIVEADLNSDKGWAEAVAGMDYVQHVASPFLAVMPKDPDELIRPARDGALRVLKAAKAAGVKRVVLTSSMAAIAYGWGDSRPNPLTEEHWSDPGNLSDNTAYTRSKTIAERAAWDYVNGEGAGLELSVINPSAVLGPAMSADVSTSLQIITQLMTGKAPASPRVGFCVVDVRDVADAHLKAMTVPAAAGERFLAAGRFMWMKDVADVLRENFPDYQRKLPKGELPDWLLKAMTLINPPLKAIVPELGRERHCANDKARQVLGWRPRPEEESIVDSAQSLIDLRVI